MEDATIKNPSSKLGESKQASMYQHGRFPSIIDTDDLVFELGLQRVGNINKGKLIDKLLNENKQIKAHAVEFENERAAMLAKIEQVSKSNKLYEGNNRKLDDELTKIRSENFTLTKELTKTKDANIAVIKGIDNAKATNLNLTTELSKIRDSGRSITQDLATSQKNNNNLIKELDLIKDANFAIKEELFKTQELLSEEKNKSIDLLSDVESIKKAQAKEILSLSGSLKRLRAKNKKAGK